MFEKIREIVCEQLQIEEDLVTADSDLFDELGADSLDIVDIVMTLEDEFMQEIPDEALENFNTIEDIVAFYD